MTKTQTIVTTPGFWRKFDGRLSREDAVERVRQRLEVERRQIDEQLAVIDRWQVACWRGTKRLPVPGSDEEGGSSER